MTDSSDRRIENRADKLDRVGLGFVSGIALHLIFQGPILLWAVIETAREKQTDRYYTALIIAAFIGATQIIYLLPLWLIAFVRRRRNFAMGVVLLFGITILLNGGCWIAALS